MLSRSSAILLSLTSLSSGILLGIVLARGGPSVSAQVAGPAQAEIKEAAVPRSALQDGPADEAKR